ncbi:MAG: DUF3347 domain-containing protein [Flavobacteriaceae bacterium]|nr:DUF3347 domain-containing protein [Flavobacteriaceae bacterium]
MKKFKIAMGMVAIALTLLTVMSCKDTKKSDEHMEMDQNEMNHDGDENMDMDQNGMQNDEMMNRDQKTSKATAVLNSYLELKNALVADNTEVAATAGKTLLADLAKFDQSSIAGAQKQEVIDIIEDAREHAEHISENSGKLDHQREHFELLSNDVKDLIAITGTDRVLYKTFCPMYNEGKGGIWLSETKEIKNPYFGSKMMKCGEIQEEIK